MNKYLSLIIVLVASFAPLYVGATAPSEVSKQLGCDAYFAHYERIYGIPNNLLSSIAYRESAKYDKVSKKATAWPWTVNAEMNGYFLGTKDEAIRKVNQLRMRGVESIDVGCMQVNLFHHKQAFDNLSEAFDPKSNVDYAARFLRSLFDETRSWRKAVTYYHSRTPRHGVPYANGVINTWRKKMGYAASSTTPAASASPSEQTYAKPKMISINRKARGEMVIRVDDADNGNVKIMRMQPASEKEYAEIEKTSAITAPVVAPTAQESRPKIIRFDGNGNVKTSRTPATQKTPVDFIFQ